MLTNKRLFKLLALLMVVSLLVAACDRPAPGGGGDDEPTPTTEGYPAAGEQEQPAPTLEPTRAEVEGGETPVGEETAGEETTGEETAEEETAEEGEAAETPEGVAEGEEQPEAQAEETPAAEGEETAEEGMAEGEETAEGEEATSGEETAEEAAEEAEAEAESGEEVAPEEAQEEQAAEGETSAQPLPATHTVAAGENLYRIGLQYGLSWVAIARANNISNPDRIYAGQVLTIPGGDSGAGGQPQPVPTPEGINYVVKPGDTLFKIGLRFGISWTEIAEANGLVNPNQIYAGQTLKIPVDAPTPPPVVYHEVQRGETLYRISLQYGVSWLAIARANDIRPPYIIYAGQTLVIPGGQ